MPAGVAERVAHQRLRLQVQAVAILLDVTDGFDNESLPGGLARVVRPAQQVDAAAGVAPERVSGGGPQERLYIDVKMGQEGVNAVVLGIRVVIVVAPAGNQVKAPFFGRQKGAVLNGLPPHWGNPGIGFRRLYP